MESVYQFVVLGTLLVSLTIFVQNVTRRVILARQPQLHVSVVYKISLQTSIMLLITHVSQTVPMDSMLMLGIFVKLVVVHVQHVRVIPSYARRVLHRLSSIQ